MLDRVCGHYFKNRQARRAKHSNINYVTGKKTKPSFQMEGRKKREVCVSYIFLGGKIVYLVLQWYAHGCVCVCVQGRHVIDERVCLLERGSYTSGIQTHIQTHRITAMSTYWVGVMFSGKQPHTHKHTHAIFWPLWLQVNIILLPYKYHMLEENPLMHNSNNNLIIHIT